MEANIIIERVGTSDHKEESGSDEHGKEVDFSTKGNGVIPCESHDSRSNGWDLISDERQEEENHKSDSGNSNPRRKRSKKEGAKNDQYGYIEAAYGDDVWQPRQLKVTVYFHVELLPISEEESREESSRARRIDGIDVSQEKPSKIEYFCFIPRKLFAGDDRIGWPDGSVDVFRVKILIKSKTWWGLHGLDFRGVLKNITFFDPRIEREVEEELDILCCDGNIFEFLNLKDVCFFLCGCLKKRAYSSGYLSIK